MMASIFANMLDRMLFREEGRKRLIVITGASIYENPKDDPSSKPFALPLVSEYENVHVLPDDESFLEELKRLVAAEQPDDVFMFPPFRGRLRVSTEFRERFPRLGLEEGILQTLAESLKPGSRVAALMPNFFFDNPSSRGFREQLFGRNTLQFVLPSFSLVLL